MDAVATATADVSRLQPLGSVTDKTPPYGVFSVSLGSGDTYSLAALHGVRHGLVTVQTFGRTAAAALRLMDEVTDALLDRRLEVEGWETTPCTAAFRAPRAVRDPDDEAWVGATQAFPFAATRIEEESS